MAHPSDLLNRFLAAGVLGFLAVLALIALLPRNASGVAPSAAPLDPIGIGVRESERAGASPATSVPQPEPEASAGGLRDDAPALGSPAPFARSGQNALQDGELVLGPAERDFDTARFLAGAGGSLAAPVFRDAAAAATIDRVAREHSIARKLLIALVELEADQGAGRPLAMQIGLMASWLADGYYGRKYRGTDGLVFADGRVQADDAAGGTAHRALAYYLARSTPSAALPARLDAFAETYRRLFGESAVLPPPLPQADFAQPPLLLPWPEGETWHYTGGPHGAWGIATAWGALDFAPPSMVGCRAAPEWVVAAAPGLVTYSNEGLVLVDLDGDGYDGTGWGLAYLHMATVERIAAGTRVQAGDRIGHPSCEGGIADGAHVHFARRYNGEWLPAAGGPAPMNLSGWTFSSYGSEYDGGMVHPAQGERMAVTSRRPGGTAVTSDNGPGRHAALAESWQAEIARSRAEHAAEGLALVDPVAGPPSGGEAAAPSEGDALGDLPGAAAEPQAPTEDSAVAAGTEDGSGPPGDAAREGEAGGALLLRLALDDRDPAGLPVVIGLRREGAPPTVLFGRLDAEGTTGRIALPASIAGRYHITARVAGFEPAVHRNVELGGEPIVVDLSSGGPARLRAGELNGDDRIDQGDIAAWFGHWRSGSAAGDLNGDSATDLRDLWLLTRNLDSSP